MKAKEIKFYVIGGQHVAFNYGGAYTLEGAKRLASKHEEYWDNWQGWHKPKIFKAEDCTLRENFHGEDYYPEPYAYPVASWDSRAGKWIITGR